MKFKKDVGKCDRLITELDESGREESVGILFSSVFEVEKKVGDVCWPGVGDAFDILDDRRASDYISNLGRDKYYLVTYVATLFPEPAMKLISKFISPKTHRTRELTFSMDPK